MSILIKICGLSAPDALDMALAAGADMVGFVFFAPSPRNIGYDTARALGQRVRGRAQKVALFVDPTDQELTAGIEALEPDMLQLHGAETPDRVAVYMSVPLKLADRLIFDARPPREATRPGGLGQSFDWQLLQNLDTRLPFMLSGGLDVANVAEALRITGAPGVDVSSGVERSPGAKDPEKIRAFLAAVRRIASDSNVANNAMTGT